MRIPFNVGFLGHRPSRFLGHRPSNPSWRTTGPKQHNGPKTASHTLKVARKGWKRLGFWLGFWSILKAWRCWHRFEEMAVRFWSSGAAILEHFFVEHFGAGAVALRFWERCDSGKGWYRSVLLLFQKDFSDFQNIHISKLCVDLTARL